MSEQQKNEFAEFEAKQLHNKGFCLSVSIQELADAIKNSLEDSHAQQD